MTLISDLQMPFQPLILSSSDEQNFIEIFTLCEVVICIKGCTTKESKRGGQLQELRNYPQTINSVKPWRMSMLCTNVPTSQHRA